MTQASPSTQIGKATRLKSGYDSVGSNPTLGTMTDANFAVPTTNGRCSTCNVGNHNECLAHGPMRVIVQCFCECNGYPDTMRESFAKVTDRGSGGGMGI